jgi:hypothetical protein
VAVVFSNFCIVGQTLTMEMNMGKDTLVHNVVHVPRQGESNWPPEYRCTSM